MAEKKKGTRVIKVVAASVAMVVVGSGAALAATIPGTSQGEALYGTPESDTIYGYGGADLIYGYGGSDTVFAGNEAGWGDKVLGGGASDRLVGQQGHDALYGEGGDDRLDGQKGDDRLVGGAGEDTLNAGPGADKVNARDGYRDVIELCGSGSSDVVYYDPGLDVLVAGCVAPESAAKQDAGVSAAEAKEATEARLSTANPPESLFGHTGKILVEHEDKELLVAEDELDAHLGHGDEILDPTGRAAREAGR